MTDAIPAPYVSPFIVMYQRGVRDEVDCAQFAKFEARLIVPSPERDMAITYEDLDA